MNGVRESTQEKKPALVLGGTGSERGLGREPSDSTEYVGAAAARVRNLW